MGRSISGTIFCHPPRSAAGQGEIGGSSRFAGLWDRRQPPGQRLWHRQRPGPPRAARAPARRENPGRPQQPASPKAETWYTSLIPPLKMARGTRRKSVPNRVGFGLRPANRTACQAICPLPVTAAEPHAGCRRRPWKTRRPATGSAASHKFELCMLMDRVFGPLDSLRPDQPPWNQNPERFDSCRLK